ncbi:MAG: fatty-acyl-CoA synthase, partial [Mycobacterium sp.]|nr:fatty-acyl-CoA synthase [Mycobacterium sp.]
MANALSGIRQKLQQITESGRAVKRLTDTGIIDLRDLNSTIQAAKLTHAYGPQATMTILGGRRYPTLPAIVDERGTLTFAQVDDQSWA